LLAGSRRWVRDGYLDDVSGRSFAEIKDAAIPFQEPWNLTANWHESGGLAMSENITPIILPTYSPELHPVENVWEYLRNNKLANRLYEIYDGIVEAWNTLMAMPEQIAPIAIRSWANMSWLMTVGIRLA
jgi:hypothetical protein